MQTTGILLLTFRELWARKVTLGLFLVSTLAWLMLMFALNLDVVEGTLAGIRIFGQETTPTEATRDPATGEVIRSTVTLEGFVIGIQTFVGGAAYLLGTLLGLFATAPLITGLLERGRIDLLLSKPLGRTRIFTGHLLGVWLTAAVLAAYLIGAVWLVMSLKSGVWNVSFLRAVPIIVVMFGVMYGVVVFLGVMTQSTALSLITAYGLIFVSAIFTARDTLVTQINPPWRQVFEASYHVLPNFIEVTGIVAKLAGSEPVASWYPLWSSMLFGAVLYLGAALWFHHRDF
ncbi:ABC transporter permease [Rhodocaloribacter sp.]